MRSLEKLEFKKQDAQSTNNDMNENKFGRTNTVPKMHLKETH